MDELVRWLGEQLDEDERTAREALRYVDAEWHRDGEENVAVASGMTTAGQQRVAITADRWRRPMVESPGVVAHVAEWDPARVLREIDAKLAIVSLAGKTLKHAEGDSEVDHYGALDLAERTLRLLALPYADRPGYREEWRP